MAGIILYEIHNKMEEIFIVIILVDVDSPSMTTYTCSRDVMNEWISVIFPFFYSSQ